MCTPHQGLVAELPPIQQLAPDLLQAKRKGLVLMYLRPLVTLALFVWFLSEQWFWLTLPLTVFHFVCTLGLCHEAVHGAVGLGRRGNNWLLFFGGLLLVESGHGFRLTHVRHHSHMGDSSDIEGEGVARGFWGSLAMGPTFLFKVLLWALRHSKKMPEQRRWILAEVGMVVVLWCAMWPLLYWLPELGWYILMMWLISWIKPFTLSYLLHVGYAMKVDRIAVSVRGWLVENVLFGLSYHMEHHLYPQVPTHRLPELAVRLRPWMGQNAHIHRWF